MMAIIKNSITVCEVNGRECVKHTKYPHCPDLLFKCSILLPVRPKGVVLRIQ